MGGMESPGDGTKTKGADVAVVEQESEPAPFGSFGMIEELWQRGDLQMAVREYRRRTPWWKRFQLSERVWGLSMRWFCVCPWNGESFWMTLPFFYFGAGKLNVEWRIGGYKYGVTFDIRWRWE